MKKQSTINKVCVVIPTYNEAKNISPLLDTIFELETEFNESHSPIELHVLVVDDTSPDGTADIVRKYEKQNAHVHLLLRSEKTGLGAAYIAGMQHAINLLDPNVIVEMDADHSHDPKDLFRLVTAIRKGADFAIGSRYINGGGIPEDWGLHRKLFSAAANTLTRVLLGVKDVSDISGGFRAIRTSVLKQIDWESLKVRGYAFQAVLLEECQHQGAKVVEIPIIFTNRHEGDSKMTIKDMIEPFGVYARIRSKRFKQWIAPSSKSQEAQV